MCKGPKEAGGPRRCSGDARAALERASLSVALLERSEEQLLNELGEVESNAESPTDDPEPSVQQRVSFADKTTRVEDIRREIDTAIANLNTGPAWQKWLELTSRFHKYSLNNQLLIMMQRPDATLVAGMKKWNELGRTNKGAKAIWINAACTKKVEKENGQTEERVVGFRPVPVYDVADTQGDPLPERPHLEWTHEEGDAPEGMVEDLSAQVTHHGYTLEYRDLGDVSEEGWTDPSTRTVVINSRGSQAHRALVLAHELAHIELGHTERTDEYHTGSGGQRRPMEVEAESVAYVLGRHYGHQPKSPFAYIDTWARGNPDLVRSTASNVVAASHRILDRSTKQTTPESR
ncbi:ImmA/IrrE family metallo-endopeptidase [Mycobacteroides abscessus]